MSTDVLGRIVEVVSGMELEEFVSQRIFRPRGMTDSGFSVRDSAKHARIAAAQTDPATGRRPAMPDKTVKSWQSGGGGMVSRLLTTCASARCC